MAQTDRSRGTGGTPAKESSSQARPSFGVCEAEADGVTGVHVDTHGMPEDRHGPIIRGYRNDEPIFENPPFPKVDPSFPEDGGGKYSV